MYTALILAIHQLDLDSDYMLQEINGKPLFQYSIEVFKKLEYKIILVVPKDRLTHFQNYNLENVTIMTGGKNHYESVKKGLKEVQTPYVFIHEVNRPLLNIESVKEIEEQLAYHDAVILAKPVKGNLKKIVNQDVLSVDEENYFYAIFPQAFLTEKIRYASLRTTGIYEDEIALYQVFYPNDKVHIVYNKTVDIVIQKQYEFLYLDAIIKKGVDPK